MTDYNYGKQMAMWKATGPVGYSAELEAAGLNKALMYGGSGAGGQTASVAQGNVTAGGGSAPVKTDQMGLLLMKAQKENIEADTANKLADVPVKGATVPKLESETKVNLANVTNTEAKTKLTEIETRTAGVEARVAEESEEHAIAQVQYNYLKTMEEVNMLVRQNKIQKETQEEVIKNARLQNSEIMANVALKMAQKNNTVQMTEQSKAQVLQWTRDWVQKAEQLRLEGKKVTVAEMEQSVDRTFKEALIEQGQWHNFIQGMNGVINMGTGGKGNGGVGKPW